MYITAVPNRGSKPCLLLRESYREGGKVKNRTLANVTQWPPSVVEALRCAVRGEAPSSATSAVATADSLEVLRSLPHGAVAAVHGTMRKLSLAKLLGPKGRERDLCLAMIAARVIEPRSKLATAQSLDPETLDSTLAEVMGVERATEDELYGALDWLIERQERIEDGLAKRHLAEGATLLYDLTSTYMEGRTCPLAKRGYSRDRRSDRPQINFGLLTDAVGRPIAVEIVAGNTGDPKTIPAQISKVKDRFRLEHVVLVGDRGMITDARIREDLRPAGLDWITSLRAPDVQGLRERNSLQLSLFDERDLAEIADPEFPDERLVVCRNPLLADERARKREILLSNTEAQLNRIVVATQRASKPLRGKAAIGLRVGKVVERWKMAKHFQLDITDTTLSYARNADSIARESALDGFYVLRTSVSKDRLAATDVVRSYKSLGRVERAFRSMKSVDLHVRPIYHRLESRVRAHIFLCMLAYYVEWHMRAALAPLLFDDENKSATEAARMSVVAPARPSKPTTKKRNTRRTADDTALPVMSFRGLLRNLGTLVRSRIRVRTPGQEASATFDKVTQPTPHQARALHLLRVSLGP